MSLSLARKHMSLGWLFYLFICFLLKWLSLSFVLGWTARRIRRERRDLCIQEGHTCRSFTPLRNCTWQFIKDDKVLLVPDATVREGLLSFPTCTSVRHERSKNIWLQSRVKPDPRFDTRLLQSQATNAHKTRHDVRLQIVFSASWTKVSLSSSCVKISII